MTNGARQCGSCTACCDGWVQAVIDGQAVYPGCPCPNRQGAGCAIYASRPIDPCVNFECGWLQNGSPLPATMRPDQAGVIVLFGKLRWQGCPVDLAVPVGREIPESALTWLQDFAARHGRPLVYTAQIVEDGRFQKQQELYGYGPPAFQQEVMRWQREGFKPW